MFPGSARRYRRRQRRRRRRALVLATAIIVAVAALAEIRGHGQQRTSHRPSPGAITAGQLRSASGELAHRSWSGCRLG